MRLLVCKTHTDSLTLLKIYYPSSGHEKRNKYVLDFAWQQFCQTITFLKKQIKCNAIMVLTNNRKLVTWRDI